MRLTWLEQIRGKFASSKEVLMPTKEDASAAIDQMSPSSCGPDGIPFEVYKCTKDISATIFADIACDMIRGRTIHYDEFNTAFMVCIPKEAEGELENGTPYFLPGNTRPISIVDAANRLLACIFKICLERVVGERIHRAQKGFLTGRRMIKNILDIGFPGHLEVFVCFF